MEQAREGLVADCEISISETKAFDLRFVAFGA
jgi:hypothetical protein